MKRPRSSPCTSGSTTYTPATTSLSLTFGMQPVLFDGDLAMLADHPSQRPRPRLRPDDLHLAADEAVLDAGDVDDATAVHHDAVLDLAVEDLAAGSDGGERTDEAVHDAGART